VSVCPRSRRNWTRFWGWGGGFFGGRDALSLELKRSESGSVVSRVLSRLRFSVENIGLRVFSLIGDIWGGGDEGGVVTASSSSCDSPEKIVEFLREGLEDIVIVTEDSRMTRSSLSSFSTSPVVLAWLLLSRQNRVGARYSSPSQARRTFLAYVFMKRPLMEVESAWQLRDVRGCIGLPFVAI
jgi:hypothetical protein